MSNSVHPEIDRLEQLLADRATVGLSSDESSELDTWLGELGVEDEFSLDLTAAAVDLAVSQEQNEALPGHLKQQITDAAADFIADHRPKEKMVQPAIEPLQQSDGFRRRDIIGVLAVAASLLFAAFVWFNRPVGSDPDVTPSVARARMIEQGLPDLLQVDWVHVNHPSGQDATGDVVWSDSQQKGFMRIRGLAKNDPDGTQYQLWIFDKSRDANYPVDGGVFDITGDQDELIIPIDAKLKVFEATQFAITVEKPGGVAVSDKKRIPLLAKRDE